MKSIKQILSIAITAVIVVASIISGVSVHPSTSIINISKVVVPICKIEP